MLENVFSRNQSTVTMADKFIKYGLPILYFLISIAFYLKTYDSAQIKITLIQIGGASILAVWLIKMLEENSFGFFKDNLAIVLPLLLFLLSGIYSYSHSPFKLASANELTRRVIYMGFALLLIKEFNTQEKFKRLFSWLFFACFVATVYGLIQYLDWKFFPAPPEPGLDPFIWRGAFGSRMFSTFGNPNFFGDFLVIMSPIALAMFLHGKKPYLLVLWLLIALNVYWTGSKGAWLGFGAGILVFGILVVGFVAHMQKDKVKKILFVMVLATLLLVGGGIFKNLKGRTDSASFRIFTWLSTWEMINTKPWIGTGIGTFYVTYPSWRRPQIFFIETRHNTETDHPEDEYLEVWYDEGYIGMGIFLWTLSLFLLMGLKNLKTFSEIRIETGKRSRMDIRTFYSIGVLSALAAQMVHNMVCVSLRFVSSGIFMWLLIGILGALAVHNPLPEKNESEEDSPYDWLTALFGVAVIYAIVKMVWAVPQDMLNVALLVFVGIAAIIILMGGISRFVKIIPAEFYLYFKRASQISVVCALLFVLRIFYGYFDADINHNLAIFYSKQGDWDNALKHYGNVVNQNPSFIMSHYFLGNVYNDRWGQGDAEKSIKKYEDVWKLAPNYVQSHHQAGLIYLKWGQDEQALAQQALQKGDQKAAAVHDKKKKEIWSKAIAEFKKYQEIDPIFNINYYRMAWIYLQLGQKDKAVEMYLEHINYPEELKKPPHNAWYEDWTKRRKADYAETCVHLGNLYMMENNPNEAEKYYKKSVDYVPNSVVALKNLAAVYGRKGNMKEASDIWYKIRKIAPDDADVKKVFQQQ